MPVPLNDAPCRRMDRTGRTRPDHSDQFAVPHRDEFRRCWRSRPFAYAAFSSARLQSYVEYGVTARNSLIVNANVPRLNFSNQYSSATSAGLGDVELSLKRRLNSVESPWVFSTQFTCCSCLLYKSQPRARNHNVDLEGRFLQGRGFTLARATLLRLEVGTVIPWPPADQVRADATLGFDAAIGLP